MQQDYPGLGLDLLKTDPLSQSVVVVCEILGKSGGREGADLLKTDPFSSRRNLVNGNADNANTQRSCIGAQAFVDGCHSRPHPHLQ